MSISDTRSRLGSVVDQQFEFYDEVDPEEFKTHLN